jgi:hypothetical protein
VIYFISIKASSNYSSMQPSKLNTEYLVPIRKQPNGDASGKDNIGQNKSNDKPGSSNINNYFIQFNFYSDLFYFNKSEF